MSAVRSESAAANSAPAARQTGTQDRIELLGVSMLDSYASHISEFARLAGRLGIDLGWHYLLDLGWIAHQLGDPAGLRVLDAGAGTGVLQWWLAEHGAQVISADRLDRSDLSVRFRMRYRVRGLRPQDLLDDRNLARRRWGATEAGWGTRLAGVAKAWLGRWLASIWRRPRGEVIFYNQSLGELHDIESNSIDAVVSVSALEHNPPDRLPDIVAELERVLRPGRRMLITVAASDTEDWLHQPSDGWCYTEAGLRGAFGLHADTQSNFGQYGEVLAGIRSSRQLREGLSSRYFESGENGMPWGVWDPKYVPAGIVKWIPTT